MLTIYKAFKFTLEPKAAQEKALRTYSGNLRYLWNWMLAQRRDIYAASEGRVLVNFYDQAGQLPAMKKILPWLSETPSQALQKTLRDLDSAFQRFFQKKAGFPAFKSKQRSNSGIHWPQGVEINGRAVWLPKLGWVKARFSRVPLGKLKSATVNHDGLRWSVSLLCEIEVEAKTPHCGSAIGIDVGVEESLALSDGRLFRLPVATKEEAKRTRRLSRRVSRCKPSSLRRAKARKRLLAHKRRIGNRVSDARHKLTTTIAKNHGVIVVEDLALKNMTRSARGTVATPGRNVAQKSGLNRSLLQQGHAETVRQLEYKASWQGGELRRVNPAYTSQTCPHCGHVSSENRPKRAIFHCTKCDFSGHADVIAANNILAAGHAVIARGGVSRPIESRTNLDEFDAVEQREIGLGIPVL